MVTTTIGTITVNLPADLSQAIDQAVEAGIAKSRDDFILLAVREKIAAQKQADELEAQRRAQVPNILADIESRRRVNPADFGLPDSTILIREERNR
ncbi:MAG: hypothetical protein AB4352_13340 [Hormoscilla sp.]